MPEDNTPAMSPAPSPEPPGSSLSNPRPAVGPNGENTLVDWLKAQAAAGKLGGKAKIRIIMPSGKVFEAPLKKP